MSKEFDIPSNKHLGNSNDYWKAPQKNSKQIVIQPMQWIKIDRDENGFATEECLNKMRKAIPFVFVATKEIHVAVGNEYDFDVYIDGFKTDSFDVSHYLPIPKLEV